MSLLREMLSLKSHFRTECYHHPRAFPGQELEDGTVDRNSQVGLWACHKGCCFSFSFYLNLLELGIVRSDQVAEIGLYLFPPLAPLPFRYLSLEKFLTPLSIILAYASV